MNSWEKANVLSSIASAIGAIGVLSIAIWGFFFTSIPEELVARLNSDVAETKTNLALAKKQELELKETIKILNEKRRITKTENNLLVAKNKELSESYEKLTMEVNELIESEKYRRNLYVKTSLSLLLNSISLDLQKYKEKALYATNYNQTLDWISAQPDRDSDEFNEWLERLREKGISYFQSTMFDGLEEISSGKEYEPSKKLIKEFTTIVDNLMESFDLDKPLVTGESFIKIKLEEYRHSENDEYTFNYIQNQFYSALKETPGLKNSIEPILLKSFSPDEIVEQGKKSLNVIILLENLIARIELAYE